VLSPNIEKADQWYKLNSHILKKYRGEWIAFTADGIIAHHRDYFTMESQIDTTEPILVVE
jgi:Family of unknown function (DUF5678)